MARASVCEEFWNLSTANYSWDLYEIVSLVLPGGLSVNFGQSLRGQLERARLDVDKQNSLCVLSPIIWWPRIHFAREGLDFGVFASTKR